jgi:hypothetical protein
MVNKIIEEIKKMERELEQLKFEKSQTEAFLAAIVKQLGEIELNLKEVFIVEPKRVKVQEIKPSVIRFYYESE